MSLLWVALRTLPIARAEFSVMHALNQKERPALVPFEEKWVRKPRTKLRHVRKYALFPRYVFCGFHGLGDYQATVDAINEEFARKGKAEPILGAVRFGNSAEPAKLSATDVSFLRGLSTPRASEIRLHAALRPGERVSIMDGPFSGHVARLDTVSRNNVTVMLKMFNSLQVVRLPVEAVEAA
jgi:transcription antitermination factor NusG